MLRKTAEILRARWPEAMLLTVSQAAMMLLFEEMVRRWGLTGSMETPLAPEWAMFLLGMAVTAIVIVWHLLLLGFLKTAVTDGATPKEPLTLLMIGRPYLWRILLVQFLLAVVLWFVTGILIHVYSIAVGQSAEAQPPGWLLETAAAAATVVLFKPVFLMPAFIVALNLKMVESLYLMFRVNVKDAAELLKAVLTAYAAVTIIGVLLSFAPQQGALMYAASAVNYLVKSINLLVLLTAAVLWTAQKFLPPPPEPTE